MVYALAVLVFVLIALVFCREHLLSVCVVSSDSMLPTLQTGDILIINHLSALNKGDIAVFKGPDGERWVKRVDSVVGDYYYLLGDNRQQSLDSRHIGAVPKRNVYGRVIKVISPNA